MWSNTDEFRTAAIEFKETGKYCKYPKGSRGYDAFWKEEKRRSLEGYHIGRDYITGYHYWYLNYCIIQQVIPALSKEGKILYDKDGNIQGEKKTDFPLFWDSDALYFNYVQEAESGGKHCVVLKARRKGYSYKNGSMLTRNYFLVPGSKSYAIAAEQAFLLKDGVLAKAFEMMSHVDENTAFYKRREFKNLPMHKRASYKWTVDGVEIEKGYKSEIIGLTLKNDVQRMRGISGKLILFEEAGKFPDLLTAWNIAKSSVKQGNKVYGTLIAFGTGGTEGGDFESLNELFNSPEGYGILPQQNTWSSSETNQECGFFVPDYYNLDGYYDKDGNSDVDKALKYIEKERKNVLDNTRDTLAYKRHCAEHPIVPQEATMQLEGNIFPAQDLMGVLARLETEKAYEDTLQKGKMIMSELGVPEFREDKSLRIIYNFPTKKEDNLDGPIIIYEQPYRDGDNNIPYGLHVGAIDSYDLETGTSLGSCLIINKVTNRIVAEYTARPKNPADFYEQCRRLLLYYNAKALYENGNKGIFTYFEGQGSVYLLHEEPLLIKEIIKNPGPGRKYGVRMVNEVKRYAETLVYQWLTRDYDKDKNIKVYHKIRSIGLLKELCAYNQRINADRCSALICLMLQLDEEKRYIPKLEENNKIIPATQRGFFGKLMSNPELLAKNTPKRPWNL